MKKILSLVIASAMVAAMAVTAFAVDKYHHLNADKTVDAFTNTQFVSDGVYLSKEDATKGTSDTDWGATVGYSSDGITKLQYFLISAENSRKLAEGEASVKINLTDVNAYASLADFQKDYSLSYKVKSGPVKSVALKYNSDKYKFGDEAKSQIGSIPNPDYQKVQLEIKFDKVLTTVASTPYEIEVDINDKVTDANDIKDCTIKGSIINEAYKPEFEDEFELTFEGYGPVIDFDNFKNDVSEIKFTFSNNEGDEILDVAYKGVQSGKVNFGYNFYQNSAIVNKYGDVNFDFINFVAAPKLAKVADIKFYSDYDKGGVFQLNADGSIQNLGAKYNSTDKCYEFKSATLGSFFVASDASKIITAPVSSSAAASSSSATGTKTNPGTGASDIVNVAVVMSVVSLAAAGAVAFKKASK